MGVMDYKQIIKYWSKVWDQSVKYAETLHWGYIGAFIFLVLFVAFLYELMSSSEMSIKFLLILAVFLCIVYYFGSMFFGGMTGPPAVNN